MRSLFAKILGWWTLATLATIGALILATAVSYDVDSDRPAPFSMMMGVELGEATQAWENGGPDQLRATLKRFSDITHATRVFLTDGKGTDLLTGQSHANIMPYSRAFLHDPFARHSSIFGRKSDDGRYCLFLIRGAWYFWFIQPVHIWVLLLVVLMCYLLARHLTAPLRNLRDAVERLGRGDLTARAEDSRRDELGELAASFNRMAVHIETLLAAERRLLFDISHELRSPLARLAVAVELARTNEQSGPPLDRIQKEADRLNELIREMLEVTRAEGEPSRMKLEHLRLDELVHGLVDDCSIEAQARGCDLDLIPMNQVILDGDSELVRRAIENVLRNAIRYAPPKSKIEISVRNGGGWAKIRVRDYGPGVPEDALPRLFDPFYRVESDRDRKSGGVGLGLSIARRAVELHKGHLRASNAVPGLLVEIDFPV